MKWIFGLVVLSSFFTACDNDLVVVDKWQDIPVVWGLLSKSDTAHYIRVEKAYLDPTTSALDIARFPDSLYYDDAVVTLKRVNTGQVFTLQRVDGDLEGYPREGGIFAETPNYLYKLKANIINLAIGELYEFGLQKSDLSPQVVAQTIILPAPVLRNPNPASILSFKPKSPFTFLWNEVPEAGIFDLKMGLHYLEKTDTTGSIYMPKYVEWSVVRNLEVNEFFIDGGDFYKAVKGSIEEDFHKMRIFESIDIIIWIGGEELFQFIKITNANTGITSTQDIPEYTNLSEGIGIFTSRNVSRYTNFELTQLSLDSLKNGSATKLLNFQ